MFSKVAVFLSRASHRCRSCAAWRSRGPGPSAPASSSTASSMARCSRSRCASCSGCFSLSTCGADREARPLPPALRPVTGAPTAARDPRSESPEREATARQGLPGSSASRYVITA